MQVIRDNSGPVFVRCRSSGKAEVIKGASTKVLVIIPVQVMREKNRPFSLYGSIGKIHVSSLYF